MLSIRMIGLASVINNLRKAEDPKAYYKARNECLDDAVEWAKIFAPVDTGELESSIRRDVDTIVADAPWAVFNEYGCYNIEVGTVKNPKGSISTSGKFAYRPFLRPALLLAIQDFPQKLFSTISASNKGVIRIRVASMRV